MIKLSGKNLVILRMFVLPFLSIVLKQLKIEVKKTETDIDDKIIEGFELVIDFLKGEYD